MTASPADPPRDDPRPGQRFTLDTSPPPDDPIGPAPRQAYAADQPSRPPTAPPSPRPTEDDLGLGLMRPRRRRWGLAALLTGGLTLGAAEFVVTLPAALRSGDWLASGWHLLGLGAIGLGALALGREVVRLRRLRRHDRLRERLARLPEADARQGRALAQTLREQLGLDDDHPHWLAFCAAAEAHHDGRELHALLAHHLLAPRDREAQRLISRMAGETAVMVAMSPLTLVDMGLVAWRSLAMIERICRLYGLELGYASRLRLLRGVLYSMAFAGASELASEAGMEVLSLNLAGRLSTRAGQGLGIGLLSARLGLRAQRLVRPLSFAEGDAPRIADLRRTLWLQLRRLDQAPAEAERAPRS